MVECAIMLALSVVLSVIAPIKLPFGGSVTIFSQLPCVIASYRHGLKWGLATSSLFGLISLLLGLDNYAYIAHTFVSVAIFVVCDYIGAFGVLGLGGIFRKVIKNQTLALACGAALVSVLRYIFHVISGITIWKGYAEDMSVFAYSVTYNATYMLPELIVTVIGAVAVGSIFKDLKKQNPLPAKK